MARPLEHMDRPVAPQTSPSMAARVTLLERRVEKLQQFVDAQGRQWAATVTDVIHSAESAQVAVIEYDLEWLSNLPYSRDVVGEIARELSAAARLYVVVNTSTWDAVAADPISMLNS